MDWFILSLLTALAVAVRDVSVKKFHDLEPLEVAAVETFWSLPLFAAGFAFVPTPQLDHAFWSAFLWSLPLNIAAYILYLYAIKLSPISLTVPFLSLTPVFMILTGYLTIGETITLWGGLGVGLIVAGSYILNSDQVNEGVLKPFIAFAHEKGSWMMLIVAFLFAFAAVIGKKAMIHSSPLFFSYFFFLTFNLIIVTALILSRKMPLRSLWHNRGKGIWLGSLLATHISCHALAITIATAVYMIAVKRSSIVFSVILSWLILKEEKMRFRLLGSICMFGGILLITLMG